MALSLIGVVVVYVGLMDVSVDPGIAGTRTAREEGASSISHGEESVAFESASQWLEHLHGGGTVRMEAGSTSTADGTVFVGLGKLNGADLEFARGSIQHLLKRRLEEVHRVASASTGAAADCPELLQLREARVLARLHAYEAYAKGLEAGHYYLVSGADAKPPTPAGYSALNVPVTHEGKQVLCVVCIRDSDYGLDAAEAQVAAAYRAWLRRRADDFNGLDHETRHSLVARFDRQDAGDAQWRQDNFPPELRLDRQRLLLLLP